MRKRGRDPFQHPGAAEIQTVEMREFPIGWIGDDSRLERHHGGQKLAEPGGVFRASQDSPDGVRFRETWRKEVLAGWFVPDRAIAVGEVEVPDLRCEKLFELVPAGGAGIIEHQADRECGVAVLA